MVVGRVMQNRDLARDYVWRSEIRLRALAVLYDAESWADVVRESQEIVELALKGLLRSCGVAPPRMYDVSTVLLAERDRLPPPLEEHLDRMVTVSRRRPGSSAVGCVRPTARTEVVVKCIACPCGCT